jgi:hypothetical protein
MGIQYLNAAARTRPHVVLLTVIAALRPIACAAARSRGSVRAPRAPVVVAMGFGRAAPYAAIAPVTQVAALPVHIGGAGASEVRSHLPRSPLSSFRKVALRRAGRVPELGTTGTVNCQQGLLTAAAGQWQARPETQPVRGG